ncbi:MAG: multicopper oxidase domain-containing protein [Crocinitomicaceae bacterium]|nr:multicopper oxidase domain-containing protein [Crocinitomicaceae bacterium]
MKKLILLCTTLFYLSSHAQNALNIPPSLTGGSFTLTLDEGTTQFYSGVTTNTMGANGSLLGPTLIMDKGSNVSITVDNQLADTTTIHWHGLHVSPENDGGPHTVILPNTTWYPSFTVLDKAGTYWYHPHLHMKTNLHVSKGIAGMILVRDTEEAGLNLPMTYGVDEFPLVLQTKGFDATGQIEVETNLDTSVMVNGTVDAYVDFPAQVVRLRVLNGSSQRVMEIGFSDNRNFSLIGTDGGLLAAPVTLNRYTIAPGQRADILLDLTSDLGNNIQLMSYGSEIPSGYYGAAQPGMGPGATSSLVNYTSNPLNGGDYQLLDITVVAQTGSPVTSIPSTLATFTPLTEGSEQATRSLTFTASGAMNNLNGPFLINGLSMDLNVINYTIPLDNIEIWSLTNQTPIAHPFHIHDVQFFILDIGGTPPPPELQGYNDVVLVPAGMTTVRFIAQFNDHENDTLPYMYHCHMLPHEDMGMMGQFIVTSNPANINENEVSEEFLVYPNPSNNGSFQINSAVLANGYSVYTSEGKLIKDVSFNDPTSSFELIIQNEGVYILEMRSIDSVLRKMIVVQF